MALGPELELEPGLEPGPEPGPELGELGLEPGPEPGLGGAGSGLVDCYMLAVRLSCVSLALGIL